MQNDDYTGKLEGNFGSPAADAYGPGSPDYITRHDVTKTGPLYELAPGTNIDVERIFNDRPIGEPSGYRQPRPKGIPYGIAQADTGVTNDAQAPSFFPDNSPVQDMPSFFPVDIMDNTPTVNVATERSRRYDYAMDKKSPGQEQLLSSIVSGNEETDRLRASLQERTDLNLKRAGMIQRYISQMGPGGITAERLNELQQADRAEVEAAKQDPKTYYERKFAEKAATEATTELHDGTPEQQAPVKMAIDSFNHILINQQTARKFYEDTMSRMEDRTYGQAAKEWVPFYRYLNLATAYKDPSESGGLLLGSNMRSQIEAAYRLSPDKFYDTQNEVIRKLTEKDPGLAAEYASALLGYTAGTAFMDNVASAADLSIFTPATIAGIGKLGYSTAKAAVAAPGNYISNLKLINAAGTLKGVTKSLAGEKVDYIALLPQARQAQVAAIDSIRRKALNTGQVKDWEELAKTIQPIINPQSVLTGAKNMTVEEAARLEIGMLRTSTTALDELISRPATLERLSGEEVALATERAVKFVDDMYKRSTLGSRILQVKSNNIEAGANLVNTDAVAVYVGSAKATGYARAQDAALAAKNMGIEKFATEEINGSHYIKMVHYIDETDPTLRSFAKSNAKYETPNSNSLIHGVMSRVRMRDSLIPKQLAEDFKVAQGYTNQYFENTRSRFIEDFSGLNKQSRKDLDHFIESERDFREQNGPANQPGAVTRGQTSSSVGEFEKNFMKFHQRFPTFEESKTYFAWKQWNDVDYAVRNLDLTRDMARIGINSHELRFRLPGGIEAFYTPKLEGKVLIKFPWDRKGDAGILEWNAAEPWNGRRGRKTFISDKPMSVAPESGKTARLSKEEIDDMIENQGYRVLHLTPWAKKNLRDVMKTWGGYGGGGSSPMPGVTPVPKPKAIPLTKNQQLAAAITAKKASYLEKSVAAKSESERMYYSLMMRDRGFGEYVDNLPSPPESIAEIENTITDYYGKSGLAGKHPDQDLIEGLAARRRDLGGTIEDSKIMQVIPAEEGLLTKTQQRSSYANMLQGKRTDKEQLYHKSPAAAEEPQPYHQFAEMAKELDPKIASKYQVHGMMATDSTTTIDQNLINLLEDGLDKKRTLHSGPPVPGVNGIDSTRTYGAPYLIISDKGKKIKEVKHVILQGPAESVKGILTRQYPDVNFMSVAQAKKYIETGVAPYTPNQIKALKAQQVAAAGPLESAKNKAGLEFEVGDEVDVHAGPDKVLINAKPTKITDIRHDPKHGTYVQVEGSQSYVNIEDIRLFGKKQKDAPKGPETSRELTDNTQGWDPGAFDYILIKPGEDMRTSALDFIRFPRQEGGHIISTDEWHLRQAQIYEHKVDKSTIHTYEGDKNAYSATLESDAREMHTHLETIRNVLKDDLAKNTNNAEAYYNWKLQGTSGSFKDFKNRFKEFNKEGELTVAHPFVVTPHNQSSFDYIKSLTKEDGTPLFVNLENQRDSAHNLFSNELNLQFAMQRSDRLDTVVRRGTVDQPTFGTQAQGRLSPMATMINTTSQMIRGRVIDDLKIKSAENFAKNFAAVIDAPIEAVQKDPMYYILNPRWRNNVKGSEIDLLNAAKDYRRAVVDFMGVESPTRDAVLHIQRTAAETIKQKLGPNSYDWVDRHLLRSGAYNPVRWLNNVVFDLFFGVLNVKQLAVQAMTSFHTAAVLGPKLGLQAGFAAHLVRPLLYNEFAERTATMAGIAAKLGIKKEHFTEALASYKRSGWHIIGGETALQDDFINQSIKESFVERSRQMGRVFFKEGDRFTRSTAYMGAYLEWRQANPLGKLTPRIEHELLNRADTLSLNMTSASNAMIAKGAPAIPLKFTTYYARMMEQMLPGWTGSALTPKERMRAYAMYSVAFGAPITASGTFGLWPFHKEVSKALIERGYDTDENKVLKFFNEGLAGLLPSLLGVNQNISEALGPSGSSWLYDIVNGRSEVFDIVTGVAGTKVEDTTENAWPFFTLIANQFRGDDKKYPLSWQDLELFARSISSVNNVWRAAQMHNTGVYMTKNRTPLMQGVDDVDALYSLILGTEPSKVQRAFLQTDMTRSTQKMKDAARKDIMRYHRLQMKSIVEGDADQAVHYGKAVKFLVNANGFTPDEYNRLFSDAISANGDLVHQAERKFNQSTPERQQMYLNKIRNNAEGEQQ